MNKIFIRTLIAKSDLKEALEGMLQMAAGTRCQNDVLLLSARFREMEQHQMRGTQSTTELNLSRNQITRAMLELLEELPENTNPTIPTIKPEVEKTIEGKETPPTTVNEMGDGRAPIRQKRTDNGAIAHKTSVWIGLASLAAILSAVIFVPCPSSAQFFVFRLILALGAAGIGSILPGFFSVESGVAKAGGALGVFALVYLLNPATLVADDRCKQEPFTMTVSVRSKKPSAAYPDLKNAELWLWQRNEWNKVSISPDGIADFKNLDPSLAGKHTAIQLKAIHFRSATDSLLIQPPATQLDLLPDGSLERVFGKITDARGQGLPGVQVEVEGQFATTDAAGNYELRIPLARQRDHYLIYAMKKGWTAYHDEIWPASGKKDFSLKK